MVEKNKVEKNKGLFGLSLGQWSAVFLIAALLLYGFTYAVTPKVDKACCEAICGQLETEGCYSHTWNTVTCAWKNPRYESRDLTTLMTFSIDNKELCKSPSETSGSPGATESP